MFIIKIEVIGIDWWYHTILSKLKEKIIYFLSIKQLAYFLIIKIACVQNIIILNIFI